MRFFIFLLACVSTYTFAASTSKPWSLKAPSERDYTYILLKAALDETIETHGPYQLDVYSARTSLKRTSYMLEQGDDFQITKFGASYGIGKNFIPIKIPLYQGMFGFRLLVTNQKQKKRLEQVQTLSELRQFTAGFNKQWSDFPIFEENQLPVETAIRIHLLFNMLKHDRFDYFPRSIRDIDSELAHFQDDNNSFQVLNNIALFYPHPVYFHVSPRYKGLAERIKIGLQELLDNGQFKQIFLRYHHHLKRKYIPPNMHIIRLERQGFTWPIDTSWWLKQKDVKP